jgi:glucose/mannose-6-phosphate isomerase
MINAKYYNDVKMFPREFKIGIDIGKEVLVEGDFDRAIVCGMGGSALYVELINDFLASKTNVDFRLEVQRSYSIPNNANSKTLFFISSYSGGTEETLSCLAEVKSKGYKYCIVTSGGKLLEDATSNGTPVIKIPGGIQPRLSTGYFIGAVLKVLSNINLIPDFSEEIIAIADRISINEDAAKSLAEELKGKLPIIYTTDNIKSLALITKIKFNENSKMQAFWNYFPELNHNEMVGFSQLVTEPYFIMFKSKFTNPRNIIRIETFMKLMNEKGLVSKVIDLKGESPLEEILDGYYFADYVTYYLAESYGVDPEPVAMVEDFKKQIG